jgi:hypothetical protein
VKPFGTLWQLGKVVNLFFGSDGKTGSVEVRLVRIKGIFAFSQLYPMGLFAISEPPELSK